MSFTVKGVEPTKILVEENDTVTEITKILARKGEDQRYVWIKPYTLTISKGSHSTIIVGYKSSQYSSISSELSNGATIRHGSYLDITVTGHQGYAVTWKINGVTQSSNNVIVEVTGDIAISVTETSTLTPLAYPVISGTLSYDSYMGSYYLWCKITNNNPRAVTANIVVYSDGDRLDGTWSMNIPANSTEDYAHGEMYSIGAKVQVTFSCAGYGDSTATTTFGRYTGSSSGNTNDETTTTTS